VVVVGVVTAFVTRGVVVVDFALWDTVLGGALLAVVLVLVVERVADPAPVVR
jgi:hypothetical protein